MIIEKTDEKYQSTINTLYPMKNKSGIVLSLLLAILFSACKDEVDLGTPRLFRPISLEITENTETSVNIKWAPVDGAETYTLEISTDKNFGVINQTISGIKQNHIVLENGILFDMTEYYDFYLRVKADAAGERGESFFFTSESAVVSPYRVNVFSKITKNGVVTIKKERIFHDKVELYFTDPEVTHIRLETIDGQTTLPNVPLTPSDIEDGYTEIAVSASTSYYAYIYNGSDRKGRVTFTTTPATEVIVDNSADLKTILETHEPGAYIRVKPGSYSGGTMTITDTKSFTLISFAEEKASLDVMFKPKGIPGDFIFEDIIFDSDPDTTGTSSKDGIIDCDGTEMAGGNILIKNCEVYNYRKSICYFRATASGRCGNITIDGCIIDNMCSSQGFIDFRAGSSGNITIKNSTLSNFASAACLVRYDNIEATNSINVEVDKCSFYNITNTQSFAYVRKEGSTVVIRNSILENVKASKINEVNTTMEYNYYFSVESNAMAGSVDGAYTAGTQSGYANAAAGDFTPKGGALTSAAGKKPCGDPRWVK
jgi:hypothetical protein